MSIVARSSRKPLWPPLRRVLFRLHLWGGVSLSLYILVICLSGSAIVFRRELDRTLCPTGCEPHFVTALASLHDDLASGPTGRWVNGFGALGVMFLAISGAILWWPGARNLRRAMTVRRGLSGHLFLRDLHGVLGFWLVLLLLLWALTGIYFSFPVPFDSLVQSLGEADGSSSVIEDGIARIVRLHFGRAFGHGAEALWVMLGFLPTTLVVTGLVVWWHRVSRRDTHRYAPSGELEH